MHLCSNASELCEVQKLKGVTALSSKAVYSWPLRSSTGAIGLNRIPMLQCCASLLKCSRVCEVQKLKGVTALSSKAVTAGLTEQHWCSWHEQVSQASVMCIFAEMQQQCVKCKNS